MAVLLPQSLIGIYMGIVTDNNTRTTIFGLACILWSSTTLIQGEVDSFSTFALMRFLFGVFGSAANAPAYSLTREFFPPNYITTANSILALSVYFGGCISSLSIIFIRNFGWREDYNLTGLIGIVLGIACLTYI